MLVSKLHITQYREWKKLQRQNAEIDLEDLSSFLITLVEEIPINKFTNHDPKRTEGRLNAHHETKGRRSVTCFNCQGPYVMSRCGEFRKVSSFEREHIAKNKKMCMSCLSSTEHVLESCPTKRECGVNGCTKCHHHLLHRHSVSREVDVVST
jgi:hypothetical protein